MYIVYGCICRRRVCRLRPIVTILHFLRANESWLFCFCTILTLFGFIFSMYLFAIFLLRFSFCRFFHPIYNQIHISQCAILLGSIFWSIFRLSFFYYKPTKLDLLALYRTLSAFSVALCVSVLCSPAICLHSLRQTLALGEDLNTCRAMIMHGQIETSQENEDELSPLKIQRERAIVGMEQQEYITQQIKKRTYC